MKDYSEITLSKLINETLIQEEEHKYYMYTTQILDNGLQLKSCTQFIKPLEREQQISRLKAEKTEYERTMIKWSWKQVYSQQYISNNFKIACH